MRESDVPSTVRGRGGWRGVLVFDADELRAIAASLSPNDTGATEMLDLADELDRLNGDEQ